MKEKQILRAEVESFKKRYEETDFRAFSKQIFQKLINRDVFKKSECILAYYSFAGEVATHAFIEEYFQEKKIILPVVKKHNLVLKEYTGKDNMALSNYGILEPTGPDFTDYNQIDLGIIPGMMFDRKRNRLGRGKGYYDKLIPLLENAYLIGVCFDFQLADKIPVELHDEKMDSIISDAEIVV